MSTKINIEILKIKLILNSIVVPTLCCYSLQALKIAKFLLIMANPSYRRLRTKNDNFSFLHLQMSIRNMDNFSLLHLQKSTRIYIKKAQSTLITRKNG